MSARIASSAPLSASVTGSNTVALAALVGHLDALAEIRADHRARRVGELVGEGDGGGVDGHPSTWHVRPRPRYNAL